MTRTITLIIGIVVTALAVAVPTALGEGKLAGSQRDGVAAFIANERATLLQQSVGQVGSYRDANQRGVHPSGIESTLTAYVDANQRGVHPSGIESILTAYVDANQRVGVTQSAQPTVSSYRDAAERSTQPTSVDNSTYVDANQRGTVPANPIVVSSANSGSDLQWPQLGLGFGIGIALALGLMLALRSTRQRPLAH